MNWKIRDVLNGSPKYELVTQDMYRIASRIKKIDPGYFILMNRQNGRYEVHNTENIGATFCFVVPYDKLDMRTLTYCRETRVERDVEQLVEEQNKRATKSRERAERALYYDTAQEMAGHVKHIVDRETLSSGYTGTHYIRGIK